MKRLIEIAGTILAIPVSLWLIWLSWGEEEVEEP